MELERYVCGKAGEKLGLELSGLIREYSGQAGLGFRNDKQ